jgi:hypothetical protein
VSTGSALRHGVAAILHGEILDLRHWEGAMAAPFNASSGAVGEVCSQLEQLGIIGGLVERRT